MEETLLPYCRQDTESPLSSIFFHRSCSTNWTVDNRQLPSGFVRLSSSFRRWTRWSAIRLGGALEEKSNPPSSASDETRAVLIYKSIILATPIHHHSKKQNTTSYLHILKRYCLVKKEQSFFKACRTNDPSKLSLSTRLIVFWSGKCHYKDYARTDDLFGHAERKLPSSSVGLLFFVVRIPYFGVLSEKDFKTSWPEHDQLLFIGMGKIYIFLLQYFIVFSGEMTFEKITHS